MASEAALISLHRWVEDQMHGVLGMAAPPIVAMVMDIALNCKSGKELQRELEKTSFPGGGKLTKFCDALIDRLRPPEIDARAGRGDKRTAPASSSSAPPPAKKQATEEPQRQLTKEEQREQDIKERDELAERLKQRDAERTKNVAQGTQAAQEAREKREYVFADEEERQEAIEHIRTIARRKYLGEREVKISDLRGRQVNDAEWLLKGENLTAGEQQYVELERQLYDVAKQRMMEREIEKTDGYVMPTDYDAEGAGPQGRFAVLEQRYKKTYDQMWQKNEQDQLEDSTVARAIYKYGAQKGRKDKEEKTNYDLLLESVVEFGEAEVVGGNFKAPPVRDSTCLLHVAAGRIL